TGVEELAELVHDVVVEEVAEFLGLEPEAVDPGYGEGWDDEGPTGD
ncbi:MAG: Zincin-like metallopeptidase, partial [Actinomycetota bacterium]|nr:Zincin-like metallopeptidase [Actinomycetota bacterium]